MNVNRIGRTWCIGLPIALLFWSAPVFTAESSARVGCVGGLVGSRFADVYTAFAPLRLLHESYSDYLFRGVSVAIPDGLSAACDRLLQALATLPVSPTSEDEPAAIPADRATALTADVQAFCGLFRPTLEAIGASSDVDPEALELAAGARLFARIHDLNQGLDALFEETFDAIADQETRWCFAVLFTVRSIASRDRISRIDEDLVTVFYGSASGAAPPYPVSSNVVEAMAGLIALCGRDLDPDESERASSWANEIHGELVPDES